MLTRTVSRTLVVCSLIFSFPVYSSDLALKEGLEAYQHKDYTKAFTVLLPLAQQGHVEAQRKLGIMYRHGLGVGRDDVQALLWYQKAAEQGHVQAQNSLGIMYRFGLGVKRDSKQAAYWLNQAAQQGFAKAQENVALLYLQGEGVEQNDRIAFQWFKRAAVAGQMESQLNLGLLLLAGRGSAADQERGMAWIEKAARSGSAKAAQAMAKAHEQGLYGVVEDPEAADFWAKRSKSAWKLR